MIVNLSQLKKWFSKGAYPTEAQFHNWLDSFWHKTDNKIPIAAVEDLTEELNGLNKLKGESAYQIAVKNGFQGTEIEWLASLKGEKGSSPEITASINEMGDLLINITK